MKKVVSKAHLLLFFVFCFCIFPLHGISVISEFGATARIAGIGNAATTLIDDSGGLWFNPAAISQVKKAEIAFFYFPFWNIGNVGFANLVIPSKFGNFGGGVSFINSWGYEMRDMPYDEYSMFHIYELSNIFCYGHSFGSFSIGMGAKYFNEKIFIYSADNLSLMLGGIVNVERILKLNENEFKIGFSFDNVSSARMKFIHTEESLPFIFRIGVFYRVPVVTNFLRSLLFATDVVSVAGETPYINSGLECKIYDFIALRVGYMEKKGAFSVGFGVNLYNFDADYALVLHEIDAMHKFSIKIKFGRTEEEFEKDMYRIAESFYEEGVKKFDKGLYEEALSEFNKALIIVPGFKKAVDKINETEELIKKRKQKEKEETISTYLTQARSLMKERKYLEAINKCNNILSIDPDNKMAKNMIREILSDMTEEERKMHRDIEVQSLLLRGEEYYKNGNYREAIKCWEKVYDLQPANPIVKEKIAKAKKELEEKANAHLIKGIELYRKEQFSEAFEEFNQVLKYLPDNKIALDYIDKIEHLARAKRTKIAQAEIDNLYFKAANAYLKGDYREAKKLLKQILDIDPLNRNAYLLMEKIKAILGE